MLNKKKVLTLCKPIPAFIPRQLAVDVLHDHSEVITLNPLVTGHTRINLPRHASSDELACTWYEIQERIQYIPGMGQMGSGKISFTGCFHDMPWGLQTHTYAPMGIDLRVQYRVAGDQAGSDSQAPRELGLAAIGAPTEGLYLRTDIEFVSNVALASFVRNQLKAAIEEMVDRMIKRAEKLDADVLQSMIDDEKMSSTTTMVENTAEKNHELHPTNSAPATTQKSSLLYEPPSLYQTVSRTNDRPAAVELPCNYADSKPTTYANQESNSYSNSQSTNYTTSLPTRYPTARPNSYQPSQPNNYQSSQPNNYQSSQPNNYQSSQPNNYQSSQPNNYQSSQPNNHQSSQPNNYQSSQPNNHQSSQPISYGPSQPRSYTPPQSNKYMTSNHVNHMTSQAPQKPMQYAPYPSSNINNNYYPPPPPSDQLPAPNYTAYSIPNPTNNNNNYSSTEYKGYASSPEKPYAQMAPNRWNAAEYPQQQNMGKSWS